MAASTFLTDTISARFQEIHQGIETRVGAIATDIDTRVAQFEDLLGSRVEAVAGRIESSGRQASDDLMARAELLSSGIKSHVEDAERSLTNLVVNTSETIQTGARAAQQALLTVFVRCRRPAQADLVGSGSLPYRRRHRSGELDPDQFPRSPDHADIGLLRGRFPDQVARRRRGAHALGRRQCHGGVGSRRRPRGPQTTLVTASSDAASQVKSLAAGRRTLALDRRYPRPPRLSTPPAHARHSPRCVAASSEAATQVKSLAADVERSLSIAGTATAEAITRRCA